MSCLHQKRKGLAFLNSYVDPKVLLHLLKACNDCMQAVSKTDQVLSLKRYIGKCPIEVDRIMEQLATTRKQQAFLHR